MPKNEAILTHVPPVSPIEVRNQTGAEIWVKVFQNPYTGQFYVDIVPREWAMSHGGEKADPGHFLHPDIERSD